MTETQSPSEIAFSRDDPGHVLSLHLPPGRSISVREHSCQSELHQRAAGDLGPAQSAPHGHVCMSATMAIGQDAPRPATPATLDPPWALQPSTDPVRRRFGGIQVYQRLGRDLPERHVYEAIAEDLLATAPQLGKKDRDIVKTTLDGLGYEMLPALTLVRLLHELIEVIPPVAAARSSPSAPPSTGQPPRASR